MAVTGFSTDPKIGVNGSNVNNTMLPTFPLTKNNIFPQSTPHISLTPFNTMENNKILHHSINYTREDPSIMISTSTTDSDNTAVKSPINPIPNGTLHNHNQPSPEISKPSCSSSPSRHAKERSLLHSIISLIEKLKISVINELADCNSIEDSAKEAEQTLHELFTHQQEANLKLQSCAEQLQIINEKHRIYTADQIAESENNVLEEVLEKLTIGLQTATIALYHSPKEKPKQQPIKNSLKKSVSQNLKPLEEFKNLIPLGVSPVTGDSSEICSQIIEKLQVLRSYQMENVERMKRHHINTKETQRQATVQKNEYKETIEKFKMFERQLKDKKSLVEHLSGEGEYSNLSATYLQELCRIINKASRKIVTELALRDIRVRNAQSNITTSHIDKENCLVCFERKWNTTLSPCGHLLCNECSERLNFCPQCRAKIESRQKCFQP